MSRFYAEFTETAKLFESQHQRGWQIFDRQQNEGGGGGDSLAVALCRNRTFAFKIRDALNREEN